MSGWVFTLPCSRSRSCLGFLGLLYFWPNQLGLPETRNRKGKESWQPPLPRSLSRKLGWRPSWWRSCGCSSSCRSSTPSWRGVKQGHRTRRRDRWLHWRGCRLKIFFWESCSSCNSCRSYQLFHCAQNKTGDFTSWINWIFQHFLLLFIAI